MRSAAIVFTSQLPWLALIVICSAAYSSTAWEAMFAELVCYKEVHGDCYAPRRWAENKALGLWVGWQRKSLEMLSEDRLDRLNALGFDLDPNATAWENKFAELVRYKEQYGDCNVPFQWAENKQLGPWRRASWLPDV